ncbi:MBL fold metallo-hydrolase [Paenibacillus rhizovicinus]|uniref:MBL fold metallo-hydrolase n=1 Tax=Paenibacillus rhizovicinus TaxID=2704463 RepID=A0A6C0P7A5_9BACL|nr:MBL fold metallo-hydrolase [Paenibacillus rhizovicinus]QHW34339.1 MBL fold metallo-hydrolase [Paenibacillus rhizovicinus]
MLTYHAKGLRVFQSELYQTNCFVIETDDLVLVVDPNYLPSEIDAVRQYVDEVQGGRPVYLFFTHSDFDHIVGFGSFADCTVIAGQTLANRQDKADRTAVVERLDDEFYIRRPYGIDYPRVDIAVAEEGERLTIGGTTLTFRTAYGHNDDGLMCLVEPLNMLITGDYVSDIEFPFVFDTYGHYRQTLAKIASFSRDYDDLLLLPSHGAVTADGKEIARRIADSEAYLRLTEELLDERDDSRFEAFMDRLGYRFRLGFRLRHEANMQQLAQERAQAALS